MNNRQSMVILILLAVVAVAGAWLWIRHTRRDVRYDVMYPPGLDDERWQGELLGDTGHIVGLCPLADRAVLFVLEPGSDRPRVIDLKDKGSVSGEWWEPEDINANGTVVGTHWRDTGPRGFFWSLDRGIVEIVPPGGGSSKALGVNGHNYIVGAAEFSPGIEHAYLYKEGRPMRDLGTLGGKQSAAYAINDTMQVVGWAETARGVQRAFLWTESRGMTELQALGISSAAYDINKSGQVIGSFVAENGEPYICLWDQAGDVAWQDRSVAYRASDYLTINDAGQFFVNGGLTASSPVHLGLQGKTGSPRLWSPKDGYINLDRRAPPGTRILWALDINNRGEILVVAREESGFSTLRRGVLKPLDQAVVEEKRKDQP